MCRIRAWSCWDGDCTACQKFASSPPQCVTTLFGSSPPTTLILNSPSLKSLVKEGGDVVTSVARLTTCSTRSSIPCYFLNPWTTWWQKPLLGDFLALPFSAVIGYLYMRRRLPWVSHMIHPHHGTAPSCFCIVQNTTRTGIPSWSIAGTSYFKNRFCTSGWPLPVDSLSGRFNYICVFVWRNLLQLAPSSHQNSLFQIIGMLNADLGMLSAFGMLNLGMLDAGFGMLSASGMQDLVCCLHLVCRIFFYIFASVLL